MKDAPDPHAPHRLLKFAGWALGAIVMFVLGVAAGTGGDTPALQTTTPQPAVTVTAPAVAPSACLDAISYGETGFGYASTALQAAGDIATALGEARWEDAATAQAQLAAINKKIRALAPKWNASKATCRSAG